MNHSLIFTSCIRCTTPVVNAPWRESRSLTVGRSKVSNSTRTGAADPGAV